MKRIPLKVEADVYPAEASQIRIGTTIKVSVNGIGDQVQTATINFNSPQIQAATLPLDAVIRDENGAHVWVKIGKNTFETRMVITGEEDANQIIILSGLENIGEVVISGAYLLSSEFILKKGTQLMDGMKM